MLRLIASGIICLLACATGLKSQSFLHASGSRIVDAGNQEVFLHGMNLGGWLLMEGYMLQVDGSYPQWQIKRDMWLRGASETEIELFFSNWRKKHTTAADFAYLKSLNLNCVRLPMHYELFLTARQRTSRNDVIYGKTSLEPYIDSLENWYDQDALFRDLTVDGFAAIDSTLQWAGANGMWVIPDLHSAPGGQGLLMSISDALLGSDLWNRTDSKGRKIYQLVTNRLWKAISGRYKNDARIAMYDLVNEPNGYVQGTTIKNLYDSLISTIRGNGDNHLILLEGNGYGNEYTDLTPDLFTAEKNLVWNSHRYWAPNDPKITGGNPNELHLIGDAVNFREKWKVPVWVGEMGENSNDWIAGACTNLQSFNIGWCLWTEKRLGASPFFQTASPVRSKYGDIYTASGRMALLSNLLLENCIRQKDFEYAMTTMTRTDSSAPYHGSPASVPGKIFASDFDLGKNGIAYSDAVFEMLGYNGPAWNNGYMYRNDGVDITSSADTTGNGLDVAWMENNDWMNYTVSVSQTGMYSIQLRVANDETQDGSLVIKADGKILDTVLIPATSGKLNYTTIALHRTVRLPAGKHVMQVYATHAGGHLEWISFSLAGTMRDSDLRLVPNPVSYKLRIYNIQHNSSVRVFDVSGRQLKNFTVPDENYELDMRPLQKGIYMLTITNGSKVESRIMVRE